MTRTRAFPGRRLRSAGVAWMGLLVLAGCGEQDLYRPPTSPFTVTGRVAMPSETQDVAILGHYAYVTAGEGGVFVVDIQDPDHPQRVFWKDTQKFARSAAAVRTYEPDGSVRDILFVVEGTEGLVPFDATQIPDTLIQLSSGTPAYDAQKLCIAPPAFLTDSYELYLADTWRSITGFVSTPGNPGNLDQKARIEPYGYTKDVALSSDNTHVFVADDEMGVTVVDATQIYQLKLTIVGNTDLPGTALDIDVAGDFVFVAAGKGGLQILRADANYIPQWVAALTLAGECLAIAVRDGLAFLAAKDAGLYVVDVRDPYNPASLGRVPTSYAQGVAVGEGNVVCVADRDEGLIVFRGPELPADFTPPATVNDLAVRLTDTTAVELTWTAPGDDGGQGTASLYHVYVGQTPFADSSLSLATEIPRRPVPQEGGTVQRMPVAGLAPGTTYYFGLRTEDEAHNVSPLSNMVLATMTSPALAAGTAEPDSGDVTTAFTYRVTYRDPEGDAPAIHTVVIDGATHTMELLPGGDYTAGVIFQYQTTLGLGSHEFYFVFDDGHGPRVSTPVQAGPRTPPDPFAFVMVPVSVGAGTTFAMGSPISELGRDPDEREHSVTLTRGYTLGATEVTQGLYEAVTGQNPSSFLGDTRPVENVTFYDALRFCNSLSDRQGHPRAYTISEEVFENGHVVAAVVSWNRDANGYRLPTEAEWEYACRGGSLGALTNGPLLFEHCELDPGLDPLGWYCGNSDTGAGPRTHDVRGKETNAFSLYDVHGNVWEWCWDIYAEYPGGPVSDPLGPDGEPWMQRVRRGGSWFYFARDCRSASRDPYWPGSSDNTLGFRLARNPE